MSVPLLRPEKDLAATVWLLSPQRNAIARIVRAWPGLPLDAVRARVGMSWGSLYHHVDLLVEAGLVSIIADGRRRLLVPGPAALASASADVLPPLIQGVRGESARRIAQLILREGGIGVDDIAKRLSIPRSSAYYNVNRLLQAGLISREGPPFGGLYAEPPLADALRYEEPDTRARGADQGSDDIEKVPRARG